MKIRVVVASRVAEKDFFATTATGRSIAAGLPYQIETRLFANNRAGLPKVYNQAIREATGNPATLVFAHDDLHFLDYFWCNRILEGLNQFGVLGVAGNRRRVPNQPSWAFVDSAFTWDQRENLSGVVAHGKEFPPGNLSVFGQPRQRVKLLDGLLMAANSQTLLANELYFDERFDFHFYDMDFCRHAETKEVSCGTWDIALMHESGGSFGSEAWKSAYAKYLSKWGS